MPAKTSTRPYLTSSSRSLAQQGTAQSHACIADCITRCALIKEAPSRDANFANRAQTDVPTYRDSAILSCRGAPEGLEGPLRPSKPLG